MFYYILLFSIFYLINQRISLPLSKFPCSIVFKKSGRIFLTRTSLNLKKQKFYTIKYQIAWLFQRIQRLFIYCETNQLSPISVWDFRTWSSDLTFLWHSRQKNQARFAESADSVRNIPLRNNGSSIIVVIKIVVIRKNDVRSILWSLYGHQLLILKNLFFFVFRFSLFSLSVLLHIVKNHW